MSIARYTIQFAGYNCNAYSGGSYGTCSGAGGLANTGYDILLPIIFGVSLVAASLILIIRRWLRKRKHAPQLET